MAGGAQTREGSKTTVSPVGSPGLRARNALHDGDFKLARSIANGILKDAGASQAEREEAQFVLSATKVDRGPLIAGLVMLAVLAILVFVVLNQAHAA